MLRASFVPALHAGTLRLSSTMTRLVLNKNARARRAQVQEATPLWAGKSSANASASVWGQQGERAQAVFARIWAAQTGFLATFLHKMAQSLPLLVAALFGSCVGVFTLCQGSSASGQQAGLSLSEAKKFVKILQTEPRDRSAASCLTC